MQVYANDYERIKKNTEALNAIFFHQNIIESLYLIFFYDQHKKTDLLINSIKHLLINKVTYTGAIDSWNNKRLHSEILNMVCLYHDIKIIPAYLEALVNSPIKNDLFVEFDLNRYWKMEINLKNESEKILLSVMDQPAYNIKFSEKHFLDYALRNQSENYLIYFTLEERQRMLNEEFLNQSQNVYSLINLSVSASRKDDFTRFPIFIEKIVKRIDEENIEGIEKNTIERITLDYFRSQTAQRMKIQIENPDFDVNQIDYSDDCSEEYRHQMIIKHARRVNVHFLEGFLRDMQALSNQMGYSDLANKTIKNYIDNVWTDRPPIGRKIPDYIPHWNNQSNKS